MPRLRIALIAAAAALSGGVARCHAQADDSEKAPAVSPKAAALSDEELRALTPDARAARLESVLRDLASRLGSLRTLRTEFTQTKHLEVFDEDVVSRGSLVLSLTAPLRLRWEYTSPVRSVLIVNGEQARRERTSRKGERSSTKFALASDPVTAATAEQVFLWTRGDFEKGRKSYRFELVGEKPLTIRASPLDERLAKVVTAVDLRFSDDRDALVEVALSEKSKARTVIAFSAIERNPELADELFRVED